MFDLLLVSYRFGNTRFVVVSKWEFAHIHFNRNSQDNSQINAKNGQVNILLISIRIALF